MRIVLSILFLIISEIVFSQNYPIFTSLEITPPYSVKLHEYTTEQSHRLGIGILLKDVSKSNYKVKLKFKIETQGISIETSPSFMPLPIEITGGEYVKLYGYDLEQYFMPNHLIFKGYSKEKYRRTGRLPDGLYRFSVEVLDYNRSVRVSNISTQTMWIVLNEPPVLEYPKNKTNVGGYLSQPITFQWSPRHQGSPNSAFSTQYLFELFEIRMKNMDPNRAAQSLNPIFTQTSSHYIIQVLPATLNLEPNLHYAWRVKAYDTQGLDMFKNNGYSEVHSFKYGIKCDNPTNLTVKPFLTNGADLKWKGDPVSHTEYTIEWYNKKNEIKKYTLETSLTEFRFDKTLKPENTYRFRVMAKCFDITTDYTPWVEMTTPTDKVEFKACEFEADEPKPTNFQPIKKLNIGDTVRYWGYDLIITEFEKLSPGTYKGRCNAIIYNWGGIKVRMGFDNIFINELKQVCEGDIISLFSEDSPYYVDVGKIKEKVKDGLKILDVDLDKELIQDSIVLDTVQDIFVDANGVVNYIDEEGIVQPIEDADEKTEIISASGERFVVNSDNEIMSKDLFVKTKGGTKKKLKQINQSKDESVDPTQLASVVFSQIKNSKYGFDTYQAVYASLANQYQSLKFREKYPVHWKYISSFATDKVKVSHSKDIVFKNDLGIKQIKQKNQVVLRGGADGIETAIYAYQQNTKDSTETVVGKLKVISYSEKTKKIALVSVNGFSPPSGIESELNRVYKQAGINWTVTGKHSIQVIFDDGYFNHGGSGAAACYNQDQKLLIKTLKETTNIDKDTYYLFFIKDVKDKGRAIAGYMPRNRRFGFIHGSPQLHIIAHELGHGAFNLKHTFDKDGYNIPMGQTNNLMDYSTNPDPITLKKDQWDKINNPENLLLPFLQDEEDAEAKLLNSDFACIMINDTIEFRNNDTIYIIQNLIDTIKFTAKETKDSILNEIKVNWSYNNKSNKRKKSIILNKKDFENSEFILSAKEKILMPFIKDSVLNLTVKHLNFNLKNEIENFINTLKDPINNFNKLRKELVNNLIVENNYSISEILFKESFTFYSREMSQITEVIDIKNKLKIEEILIEMHKLDLTIIEFETKYGDFNKIIDYINTSIKQNKLNELINQIFKLHNLLLIKEKEELLIQKYKKQLVENTIKILSEKINQDEKK